MPSSKEVRARQLRQKERIAAQHAERQRVHERRKRIGIAVGTALVVALIALGIAQLLRSNDNKKAAASPATTPSTVTPTTAKLTSVKGKPCVGLKAPLPKGSPKFTVPAGPAPTKLTTRDLKAGTGAVIPANATVSVNYVGVACSTGKVFGSSYTDGAPLDANLNGGIIKGWSQGIPGMRVGGVRILSIPAKLAYGSGGRGPSIAPDEALYFLVAPVKLG